MLDDVLKSSKVLYPRSALHSASALLRVGEPQPNVYSQLFGPRRSDPVDSSKQDRRSLPVVHFFEFGDLADGDQVGDRSPGDGVLSFKCEYAR